MPDSGRSKDTRSLEQKLQDVIDLPGASTAEREMARRTLETRRSRAPETKAGRSISREAVVAAPDEVSRVRVVHVRYPDGRWFTMDEDIVPWDVVDSKRLKWYYD